MSTIAEPPLNDLWTIPGEEHLLGRFQSEDRAQFARTDPIVHYHTMQIHDFLQAILQDRAPAVTAEDGQKVVALIQAIYQSNRENRPVRLAGGI